MTTASRTRHPVAPRPPSRAAVLAARLPPGVVGTWSVPALVAAGLVACVVLGVAGVVGSRGALAGTVLAALLLLLWVGLRPLFGPRDARTRAFGAALGTIWLLACWAPFHTRLLPGTPLVDRAQLGAAGAGLPLHVPAAGHGAVELLLEGTLPSTPTGGAAPPVRVQLTVEDAGGGARVVDGVFEDTLRTRRLGRRGTAVVHQTHTAERRVLSNPSGGDVRVTRLVLEPDTAHAITLTAHAHRLPGPLTLGVAVAVLLAAVVAFDRFGPVPETDGALTLATGAALGTAAIFATSDAAHPDFQTLIGSAIFGGPLGFAAAALVWWVAKRLLVPPAR
jgi:hypothetical protein